MTRRSLATVITAALLLAVPTAVVAYKVVVLGYSPADALPQARYHVTFELGLDGHGDDVRVRTFLPSSDEHAQITAEQNRSPGLHFTSAPEGMNRLATWSGTDVPDGTQLTYSFDVLASAQAYRIDPELPVPEEVPASVAAYLRPEKDLQVDDPAIGAALASIGADAGPLGARLRRIFDTTAALRPRPFKGTTDALTALRMGEASCNGKSRLFVALARRAGIPARLVGGLILESGRKRTSHQWVEVYVAGHWVPFCPTNRHYAELPERYLRLYTGDEVLFRHTKDINFHYGFHTEVTMVPSPRAKEAFGPFNVWAMFERLGLPFALLRTVLMLPIGALVVVLFRNVVGMPTYGTFLPALIAAAAEDTGGLWGIAGVLVVVVVVAVVRWAVARLELLHSPTLAILLTAVALAMLGTGLVAERLGLLRLAHISLFPIAVLSITAERFYLSLTEQGPRRALRELGGTLVVILACHAVMGTLALQILVVGFPEVLLVAIAANVYLGRWVGVRLFEYLRFRQVLLAGAVTR